MLAYHNDPQIKADILAQLALHRAHDELVKGQYWENGKGCAIGCTIYSSKHVEYESRFGIPQMLAHLEDAIFEGLPNDKAKEWPERFMGAVRPGADLSCVGWQFLYWLLTDPQINPGIEHVLVKDAVKQCADVIACLAKGANIESVTKSADCAAGAARNAAGAARSTDCAAGAARSADCAESAAWSAVRNAEGVARSAAWSAAGAARNAARNAEGAAWIRMSDKLLELIEAA
jgi:hypothetical protein